MSDMDITSILRKIILIMGGIGLIQEMYMLCMECRKILKDEVFIRTIYNWISEYYVKLPLDKNINNTTNTTNINNTNINNTNVCAVDEYTLFNLVNWYESNYYSVNSINRYPLSVCYSGALSNGYYDDSDYILNIIKNSRLIYRDSNYKYLPLSHILILFSNDIISDDKKIRVISTILDTARYDKVILDLDVLRVIIDKYPYLQFLTDGIIK